MKAVLMSIKPKGCELIAKGKKTKDLKKTAPALKTPFKCYIYCTKDELLTKSHYNGGLYVTHNKKSKSALERAGNITFSGKVIGEFVCDRIEEISCYINASGHNEYLLDDTLLSCFKLSYVEFYDYLNGEDGYGWHISELKIYDEPKELSEFISNTEPKFIHHKDGSITAIGIGITRPPQSWCYVEEL